MKIVLIGYGWRADLYKRVAKILPEALQDTYLSFMLERAIETGKTIRTENQSWK
ncbi:MAG: hypothetical protein R3Y58_02580 [Eubacteriales bacterium]